MPRYRVQISRVYDVTADDADNAIENALEEEHVKGARAECTVLEEQQTPLEDYIGSLGSADQPGREP